jgi:cytochrome bd-type quinol oxidase subunit 2
MDVTAVAALVVAVLAGGVVAFQLALALGAPWGAYAMGGAVPGRFPRALRIAAIVQALAIVLLALIELSAADLAFADLVDALPWLVWIVVAISAVALVLNAITPSSGERRVWGPVSAVLLMSSLVVALTAG